MRLPPFRFLAIIRPAFVGSPLTLASEPVIVGCLSVKQYTTHVYGLLAQ